MTALRRPSAKVCACGEPVTHPSEYATRCQACEAAAQERWFAYLRTLPETRVREDIPNVDRETEAAHRKGEGR